VLVDEMKTTDKLAMMTETIAKVAAMAIKRAQNIYSMLEEQ